MIRLIFISALCLVNHFISFGQSDADLILYSPPSPNAQGLLKHVSVPVSLHTGTPSIDLPLARLKGRRLEVPVSLSYHASGIKVQDIATWAGLGWSLNAGGVVTRNVRGLPDEEANGYCGSNGKGYLANQPVTYDYLYQVSQYNIDGEPDLFYFNFLGRKGTFVIDPAGNVVALPRSNFKIEPAIGPSGTGKWVITADDGVKYTFGGDVFSRETSTYNVTGSAAKSYVSSWYLSEIKAPDGEIMTLTYSTGNQIKYSYYNQFRSSPFSTHPNGGSPSCDTDSNPVTQDRNIEVTVSMPLYLSEISSTQGKLVFLTESDRSDLPGGRRLKFVQLFDKSSPNPVLIESYRLSHSYFQFDNCNTQLCKRLRLDAVTLSANGVSVPLQKFHYNSTNLPARDAHQIDHWGYYNLNTFTSKIPEVVVPDGLCPGTYAAANREADALRSQANILTRVDNAGGGFTELTYGPNEYYDVASNTNKVAGGVRVEMRKECAEEGKCIITLYTYENFVSAGYSSGRLNEDPQYYHFTSQWFFPLGARTFLNRVSQSMDDLFDIGGHHIGYSHVKVRVAKLNGQQQWIGVGYEKNYFTSYADHADDSPTQIRYRYPHFGAIDQQESVSSDAYPFTPNSPRFWERGLPDLQETYSEAGKLIKSVDYVYNFSSSPTVTVFGFKAAPGGSSLTHGYHIGGKYMMRSVHSPLMSVKTTIYDQNTGVSDNSKYVTSVTDYEYNNQYLLPISSTSYSLAQPFNKSITKVKYPFDYVYTPVDCDGQYNSCVAGCPPENQTCLNFCTSQRNTCLSQIPTNGQETHTLITLVSNNQLSTPVEVLEIAEEFGGQKVISAAVTKFLEYGNPPVVKPSTEWALRSILDLGGGVNPYVPASADFTGAVFNIDTRLRLQTSYSEYDQTTGNVIQITPFSGIVQRNKWDDDPSSPATNTKSVIKEIKLNYGDSHVQTHSFGYKQLVGVVSKTDANSLTRTFEYDALNRLKVANDERGNVVTRTKVRLANEGYIAQIDISSCRIVNNALTFDDLGGTTNSGGSTYAWNFGDGSQSTSGGVVSHTFATAGSYTVTLNKSHPEYGTASASKTLTIAPLPSVSICVAGPIMADLCDGNPIAYGGCTQGAPGPNSPITFTATGSNGLGPYKYKWTYIVYYAQGGNSGDQQFGSDTPTVSGPYHNTVIDYSVRCEITDACGNVVSSTSPTVHLYNSCP